MDASTTRYPSSRTRINPPSLPSPPSPAVSSPGLTLSASNSSSSPPQPTTPPRQPRPRYPDLGRVPLHRRGTSQTYENLEDLLREAGYKETRIFTPESERLESQKHGESGEKTKQGVGAAVVGFLAGLVTGGTASVQSRQSDDNPDQQPRLSRVECPSSPLANRRRESSRSAESSEPQTPFMTSSIESLGDPTPKAFRRQPYSYTTPQAQAREQSSSRPSTPTATASAYHAQPYHASSSSSFFHPPSTQQQPPRRLSAAQRQLREQASKSSIRTHTTTSPNPNITSPYEQGTNNNTNTIHQPQPRPSRAGAYLRHMASTPNNILPPRPNSTPVHTHTHPRNRPLPDDSSATTTDPETSPPPPLPRKWLENVARAILLGVTPTPSTTDTHPTQHQHPPYYTKTLRQTRSSLSQTTFIRSSKATRRSGLSDQTNFPHPAANTATITLSPPALFTRLERGRAPSTQTQVLKAQVVCRSAPGSRASSLVRRNSGGGGGSGIGYVRGNHHHHHHHRDFDNGKGASGGAGARLARRRTHGGNSSNNKETRSAGTHAKRHNRRKKDPKDSDKTYVPSLARTQIEGDGWHGSALPRIRLTCHKNHLGSNNDYDPNYDHDYDDSSSGYDEEEEEEDDGELDLARMLVPPKRQQSIRSLRKHLHMQLTSPSATDVSSNASLSRPHVNSSNAVLHHSGRLSSAAQARLSGMQEEDGSGEWRRGEFQSRRGSEDDEAESITWLRDERGVAGAGGSQRSTTKVRLGLPGPWNASGSIQGYR
ncbi:hypothetical protein P691DRAFT_782009 [Macrolepiota fuliginosa MF-IS2]|uniref:Uncharacterized protein n=1 Tax=Macrolepiota fuliginosa MF-IS2 TaxID=1400762 RepID=A0A9P5XBJ6_9AGAR|nr:hypothetical protein P691DRAFT_782009 [Macrolepiota fuliginosa MF-IS2]